jgi:ribosome maturation factor RimP
VALCAQKPEVTVRSTIVRRSPLSLRQCDEVLRVLSASLVRVDGAERGMIMLEVDRLLDKRNALKRRPPEADER